MMVDVLEVLHRLPERHRAALGWFSAHAGEEVSWPKPLDDGTKLASKAKGIYKPEWTNYALSIRQSLHSPYPDQEPMLRSDGTWSYYYFQENIEPAERDAAYTNRGLVACWQDRVPVGVMRQRSEGAPVTYNVLGLAFVAGWQGGFFILEGFSLSGRVRELVSANQLGQALKAAESNEGDSPLVGGIYDARERILASIVRRRGQPEFRQRLLHAYAGRCAITACETVEVLEAAHIVPYFGPTSNKPSNGLLLRADIHTLFDLGMISIDKNTLAVLISPFLDRNYTDLAGKTLREPRDKSCAPDKSALDQHRAWSGL